MIDKETFGIKTAAYYTLGCKLNFSETSTIGQMLEERGIHRARNGEPADLCLINTCSVTELADKKSRQIIRRIARQHPGAIIAVTGCYAQLKPDEIAHIPGVDIIFGSKEKGEINRYLDRLQKRETESEILATPFREIKEFSPSCSRGDRTRYFLKVQDGCDYFCSYCTVPFARGRSRNGTIASLVEQARQVAREGG
ncbi:MAG: tRNA (N(6)-L-threonylcarbamoyladenosine(37)-C(2))-methylthiotransferase MtaB, partial [Porphyromonadaceae bacterium]|nr:tRNA (N(6)-L-threonylcarbamoyladenosine(37)-C(2))-methylthiotransferase MtaB [Porphyromonadaceae bacterium]